VNLFTDTSNKYIIFSLFNDEKIIDYFVKETDRNQSEIFVDELNIFLNKNNVELKTISNFYFANGPGSFTGIRVGLTFAKALISSGYKNVYTINSLEVLFDNYENSKAIIDARGNKYYFQEVKDNIFLEPKIVDSSTVELENINTYDNEINNIGNHVFELIKMKRYNKEIESNYLKEAF